MSSIGAFAAKTHLGELLERVTRGEEITITRRGKPIARLGPIPPTSVVEARDAVAQLRALRAETTLGGLDWRELRNTGRR